MPSLQTIARSTTIAWALTRVVVGTRTLTAPRKVANLLSLDNNASTSATPNAFIPLFGIRGMALDALILFYTYQLRWDVVCTVMLCTVPVGITDGLVTWRYGRGDVALVHAVGTFVLLGLGLVLRNEEVAMSLPVLGRLLL